MAEIAFSGVASDADVQGTLFQGIKFWLSHKVPQRLRFLSDVKANGGEVLPLEKNADVKVVDHARKEAPPGSHSYTFIEKSIRNGVLEDLDDHKVGPPEGNIRSIGSVVQPAKGTRNKYTEADDLILRNWVNDNPQKGGGTDGNEIYKQLERKHPHHPWQSWRDRWIRHLKGRVSLSPLPHHAPPTPPFDVTPTIESSKNQATTSDTAEENYNSFSDEDAEALMVNGNDIINIHPDKITEAWESWTRDHDKDSLHTAQQWHLYWEEMVRPRYLRRIAKQIRRASPEKTIPSTSQSPVSPKRTSAAPPSTFSPSRRDYTTVPEHPQKTVSRYQDQILSRRPTAALPTTLSPISKPHHSLRPTTPEKTSSLEVRIPVSRDRPVGLPPSGFSPSVERHNSLQPAANGPSDHPESPKMTATPPSMFQQASIIPGMHTSSLPSNIKRHTQRSPEKPRSPYHETLKRKHVAMEEDFPSSSPLGPISPKRRRPSAPELPLEIASTPEKILVPETEGPFSPIFINLELEEDEPSSPEDVGGNGSPLSQQLSDTLSEPGRVVNNAQAVFGDATQLIDFEISTPEESWDNQELLVQNSSQPESFDLLPPEGGWIDEEQQVEEESELSNTETYDPQHNLPDTQAILRSKTPLPDFSVPEPDGGWNNLIASSPPIMPDSPRAESVFSQTELKDQMDAWIDAHAIRGISVEQVESVLKNTSMDTALADKALRHLVKEGALPKDWKGVWTESDDEGLISTDARKIQRLQEKHGADCIAARWEFLEFYADEA